MTGLDASHLCFSQMAPAETSSNDARRSGRGIKRTRYAQCEFFRLGPRLVVQSSKFELVINAEAAKLFGLTVPPSLLAIADEVVE